VKKKKKLLNDYYSVINKDFLKSLECNALKTTRRSKGPWVPISFPRVCLLTRRFRAPILVSQSMRDAWTICLP